MGRFPDRCTRLLGALALGLSRRLPRLRRRSVRRSAHGLGRPLGATHGQSGHIGKRRPQVWGRFGL